MEPAVFRSVQRGLALFVLAGAAGGGVLGLVAGIPVAVSALFGAVAAAIAASARHVAGPRLVASEKRLRALGVERPLDAAWGELRLGFGLAEREAGGDYQRYAVVSDPRGRSFAFGTFAGQPPCRPVRGADGAPLEVVDLEEAPLLLGVLVQRMPAWQVLPGWLAEAPARPPPLEAISIEARPLEAALAPAASRTPPRVGLWAVAAKLGGKVVASAGKLGAGALKALKGTNVAMAAASAAAYSILFTWQFGLLLVLQLLVHELGHVHAMRRTGMRVRGIYFLPFGAATVGEGAFTSRRQQAYVALNGPLWGGLFTLLPLGVHHLTGQPFWAATAAWWAVLNLINLLPLSPFDGGRALGAFAGSFSSNLGVALGVAGLAGAVALGAWMGFSLVWLFAGFGALELVAEARLRSGGRALRLLPEPARFGPVHYRHLRAALGPPPRDTDELLAARELARMAQAGRIEPMSRRQVAAWGLLYAGLAAALLAVVYLTAHLPGAAQAAGVLT